MPERQIAPYGSWRSPITADLVASAGVSFSQLALAEDTVYWLEGRPTEQGRLVVVRKAPGQPPADVTPPGFSARTRVHEYGGGSFFVHGETVFFSNYEDQRLYRQDRGAEPRPITPEPALPGGLRYADGAVSPDGRLVVCVREGHRQGREAANEIVALPADGSSEPWVVAAGRDFYSFPRLSPDGARMAWTCWDHPNMPWDGTELWVAGFEGGRATGERLVAGGTREAVFQPSWSPDGSLHFVSDPTGWWNLYREREGAVEAVAPAEAEFGVPQWVFGLSTYDFLDEHRIAAVYTRDGIDRLALIEGGDVRDLALPYTSFSPAQLRSAGGRLAFIAAGAAEPLSVVVLDVDVGGTEVLKRSSEAAIDSGSISAPRPIEFPTEGGRTAFALFYPPANAGFEGPPGERPPLLVLSHGGPTSRTTAALNLSIQFWTSRGFAVVDVNYGGSTGYGREYRERLRGQWGVVDVADCVAAAAYLAEQAEVNPRRMAIRGGSAGGYTTLCALTFFDVFRAGANYFGVADLDTFVGDTHKFESRYLDSLVGPLPEAKNLYFRRSPVNFAERMTAPLITLQGLEDAIVPPSQSERVVEALRRNGIPHAYVAFEGEQHGFRRSDTIRRALEAELFFYSRVLGFDPADALEPVEIHNLPDTA